MMKVRKALLKTEVLYVSTDLWKLYDRIYQIHLAAGFHREGWLEAKSYADWRENETLVGNASRFVPDEILQRGIEPGSMGLYEIVNWLKAEFVKEASDLLRGTKEIEHSVSHLQRILTDAQRPTVAPPSA